MPSIIDSFLHGTPQASVLMDLESRSDTPPFRSEGSRGKSQLSTKTLYVSPSNTTESVVLMMALPSIISD
jgi:hypothetical protein